MTTKRSASTAASTSQDSAKKAKRQVSVFTYKKWQTNYEHEYQTLSWLRCDVDERDKSLVGLGYSIWCPYPPTDEQLVTNLCKTSKPPGQQTIVVFDPRTIQYKNVLQSMCYSMNPLDKLSFENPRTNCSSVGGGGVCTSNGIAHCNYFWRAPSN